ncbi:hypothetical protein V8C86DRAFT_2546869 [Haematococcus lacustris]
MVGTAAEQVAEAGEQTRWLVQGQLVLVRAVGIAFGAQVGLSTPVVGWLCLGGLGVKEFVAGWERGARLHLEGCLARWVQLVSLVGLVGWGQLAGLAILAGQVLGLVVGEGVCWAVAH